MGKEIKILCDACGNDVYRRTYHTLNVRKVADGKQSLNPLVYLCPECLKKTKLPLILYGANEQEGTV